jgi:D-alanyl-D-alanine carboxypeptidase
VKTGSGLEVGYCLAFSATRSGKSVYGLILAPH